MARVGAFRSPLFSTSVSTSSYNLYHIRIIPRYRGVWLHCRQYRRALHKSCSSQSYASAHARRRSPASADPVRPLLAAVPTGAAYPPQQVSVLCSLHPRLCMRQALAPRHLLTTVVALCGAAHRTYSMMTPTLLLLRRSSAQTITQT